SSISIRLAKLSREPPWGGGQQQQRVGLARQKFGALRPQAKVAAAATDTLQYVCWVPVLSRCLASTAQPFGGCATRSPAHYNLFDQFDRSSRSILLSRTVRFALRSSSCVGT